MTGLFQIMDFKENFCQSMNPNMCSKYADWEVHFVQKSNGRFTDLVIPFILFLECTMVMIDTVCTYTLFLIRTSNFWLRLGCS